LEHDSLELSKTFPEVIPILSQNNITDVTFDLNSDLKNFDSGLSGLPSALKRYGRSNQVSFSDINLKENISSFQKISHLFIKYDSPFDL
jgi:hypothetical protein